jgi:hypothetical protein
LADLRGAERAIGELERAAHRGDRDTKAVSVDERDRHRWCGWLPAQKVVAAFKI